MLKNRWSNIKRRVNVKPASVARTATVAVPIEPIFEKPKVQEESHDFALDQVSDIWMANEQLIENNVNDFEVFSWMD